MEGGRCEVLWPLGEGLWLGWQGEGLFDGGELFEEEFCEGELQVGEFDLARVRDEGENAVDELYVAEKAFGVCL